MGRELLHKGDKINGSFQYEVESVSGQGASCVVYKARYSDDEKQSHLVQIKEFYPYNLSICREQNSHNLIYIDAEQFESEKCRFIDNAKKLASLNNDEITNSGTPSQIEIFELNNTAYSVVTYDAGNIYNEEDLQTMDLTKILEIIKNLSRAVELFHKNGYVHLDIKPENFLVDNTDHITLFDVDSIVLCDEINAENTHNISYTKKWAAPEVKRATDKVISYTADIFSIGVILFEAIMCRDFLPMETVSYNRNWDIEKAVKNREEKQERKVNINPKFYHQIKGIFEKTLDRSPDKRYADTQELCNALEKALDLLKENLWIMPPFRSITDQFTGRKKELAKMNSILQKENTVFLHGFGGIGKSELALKYAEVYKADFDTVVFCKYDDSIENALLNIEIANMDTTTLSKIKELCDERTLVILDNFDVETDADDYLDEFINNYHCKKIITTRTDFSGAYKQLEVGALGTKETISLFEKESEWCPETEDEEETLDEILKLIGYHTYFTVILAKKRKEFSLSIDELKKQTEEMLLKKSGKVTVAKDGKLTTDTIDAIATKLFDFNNITENQKQTLVSLYLLSWRTVSRNDYVEIAGYGISDDEKGDKLKDSLNDLTRLGWVLHDAKSDDFYLHPIMQEMVKNYCKETNNYENNVVEYYQDICRMIEKDDAEIHRLFKRKFSISKEMKRLELVNNYRTTDIVYLSYSLFSISKESINIIFDFFDKTQKYISGEPKVFRKLTMDMNEYCCSVECAPETQIKWMKYFIWNRRGSTFFLSDVDGTYVRLCVSLYEKLGISKESSPDIKREFWSLVRGYLEESKDLLVHRVALENLKINEYESKLIKHLEEIKDVLVGEEIAPFEAFKNEKVYKEVKEHLGANFSEPFGAVSYKRYLAMINNLTYGQKEVIKDLDSDEKVRDVEKIFATAKQNSFETAYQDLLANIKFTYEEKRRILLVLFSASFEAITKHLKNQDNTNLDDYANFLISFAEGRLKMRRDFYPGRGSFLGTLFVGIYLKNKVNFKETLDEVFFDYFSRYFQDPEYLDTSFWESICAEFAAFNISNVIFAFVREHTNGILDGNIVKELKNPLKKEADKISLLKFLATLSHEAYIETKDNRYLEIKKEYEEKRKKAEKAYKERSYEEIGLKDIIKE